MKEKFLICVARARGEIWEANCLDLDIAVQGDSLSDVKEQISRAVETYFEDARKEEEPDRSALLNRRAPLRVRLAWLWPFIVKALFDRNRDGDSTIGFQVECRA